MDKNNYLVIQEFTHKNIKEISLKYWQPQRVTISQNINLSLQSSGGLVELKNYPVFSWENVVPKKDGKVKYYK